MWDVTIGSNPWEITQTNILDYTPSSGEIVIAAGDIELSEPDHAGQVVGVRGEQFEVTVKYPEGTISGESEITASPNGVTILVSGEDGNWYISLSSESDSEWRVSSSPNPWDITRATKRGYQLDYGEIAISNFQTVELPSPEQGASVGVRALTRDVEVYSDDGINGRDGVPVPEAHLILFVSDGNEWYITFKSFDASVDEIYNNLYVAGGYDGDNYRDEMYEYNYFNDEWTELQSLPNEGRSNFGMASYNDGIIAVAGTLDTGDDLQQTDSTVLYDPEEGWTEVESYPEVTNYISATGRGNHAYVAGGYTGDGEENFDTMYRFRVADGWDELESMPEARREHGMATIDNYVYVLGGRDNNGDIIDTVFRFDILSEDWEEYSASLPEPRANGGVVSDEDNDKIYYMAGTGPDESRDDIYVLDVEEAEWSRPTSFSFDMEANRAGIINNEPYTTGGIRLDPRDDVIRYDTLSEETEDMSPLPMGIHSHGVASR